MDAPSRSKRELLWALTPFAVFLVAPFLVYPLRFIRAGLLDGGDDALSNLPFLLHSARKLLHLEIFWTPSLWLGTPLLDEPEFATLYLPRLLMLPFRPVTGFALYVVLHYVLAQVSLYLYARAIGASCSGATFGALVYGFSGFMLGHRGHTMYLVAGAWSPLVLYFLRRAELGRGRLAYVGAALAFAALPLSGAVQLTVYLATTIVAVQGITAWLTRDARPLVVGLIALSAGFLLSMPQILPSIAFVPELLELPRRGFEFSVALSYDPRLIPLLVVPHDPLGSAELYSRVGAVALVFACVAVIRDARPVVRSFALVVAAALVLMMGWHVPLLPQLLQHLPVIDVLRGPARHNFELGLGTSVLAAFGFDAVFGTEARERRRLSWLVAAGVSGPLLLLLVDLMRHSAPSLPAAKAMVVGTGDGWVLAGAAGLAFALGTVGLAATRFRRVLLATALVMPVAEARISTHALDRTWPDLGAVLERTTEALGADFHRVLPLPATLGGVRSLGDNSSLLVPSVQNLYGYASMANGDAATILDLDMHGHPFAFTDLAWSRLPTVFGIDRLILPDTRCDPLDFAVPELPLPTNQCGRAADVRASASHGGVAWCVQDLDGGIGRLGVELDEASDAARTPPVKVAMRGLGRDAGYAQPLALDIGRRRRVRQWFHKGHVPQHGTLLVNFDGWVPLVLGGLALLDERLERLEGGALAPEPVPGGGDGPATSASDGHPGSMRTPFRWSDGPQAPQLRNGAPFAGRTSELLRVPGAIPTSAVGFAVGRDVRLEPSGWASFEYHLPSRPVTVIVETNEITPSAPLVFGVSYNPKLEVPPGERLVGASELEGRRRFTFTADVPAEAGHVELYARSASRGGPGLVRLSATSACGLRGYRPVQSLGSGLEVVENPAALPRAFAVAGVRKVEGLAEARRLLREDTSLDPRSTALVESAGDVPDLGGGTITRAVFGGERVELGVLADQGRPTFVVVNDRFHERWRATIDGRRATILRTNGLVRGVVVPSGAHTVVMTFGVPWTAKLGAALALLGVALAVSGPRLERIRARKSGS